MVLRVPSRYTKPKTLIAITNNELATLSKKKLPIKKGKDKTPAAWEIFAWIEINPSKNWIVLVKKENTFIDSFCKASKTKTPKIILK